MTEEVRDDGKNVSWTKNSLERHAQTVLVMVLVALLLWVGQTTQQTSLAVARLQVEVEFLRNELSRPNTAHIEFDRRLKALEYVTFSDKEIDRRKSDDP